MHNQRTLTHNFSLQQVKCFLACRERQNGLFRQSEKNYATKMMTFEDASEASSRCHMNGYVSENGVFLFCKRMALVEKNGSMLLGKFMWQSQFSTT
jgi:predicted metal-binding protein